MSWLRIINTIASRFGWYLVKMTDSDTNKTNYFWDTVENYNSRKKQ